MGHRMCVISKNIKPNQKNIILQKIFVNINIRGKQINSAEVLQVKRKDSDVGSPEVQIALMTSRIKKLTIHLQEHKHDYSTKNGLTKIIGKRSRLLRYLERKNRPKYLKICQLLGLKRSIISTA